MERRNFKEQRERLAEYGGELLYSGRLKLSKCLVFLVPGLFLIIVGIAINPGVSNEPGYMPALNLVSGIALAVGGLLFVSTVVALVTSSVRIYENALYVGSFARRVILFPEEVMYIRYGEVDAVGRQFAKVDRGYVYIKPEQGKEIKLSEYSYGGMTEYIRGWQTGHEISEPRD